MTIGATGGILLQAQPWLPKAISAKPATLSETFAKMDRIRTVQQPNAPSNSSRWSSAARTNTGFVRKHNEDAYLDHREQALWVVADGMGGHWGGDKAAQLVIDSLLGYSQSPHVAADVASLQQRLQEANRRCLALSATQPNRRSMGSTVCLMAAHGEQISAVWAGDSRLYRVRDGEVQQLTHDHSLVGELQASGKLTAEEAERHPSANVITRAVGVNKTLVLSSEQFHWQPDDVYLLCSDGLYRHVKEHEMALILCAGTCKEAADSLVELALGRGGSDNVTVVVAKPSTVRASTSIPREFGG